MDGDDRAETLLKGVLRDTFLVRIFHLQQIVIGFGIIIVSDLQVSDHQIECRNLELRIISSVFLFYSIYMRHCLSFA